MSAVIYLHPKEEIGTKMYESRTSQYCNICEWKVNRAFIFSRIQNKSWHSFESKSKEGRYVISYNLMTRKPNLAVMAEGLSSTLNYFFWDFLIRNLKILLKTVIKKIL